MSECLSEIPYLQAPHTAAVVQERPRFADLLNIMNVPDIETVVIVHTRNLQNKKPPVHILCINIYCL